MRYLAAILLCCGLSLFAHGQEKRPNILWVTCEDIGPHIGCYGDAFATTPNLDKLAAKSLRYRSCWSNAPVCAPARTTIISGLYPPSTGSEHMRSLLPMPAGQKMYPQYLRQAGYYCTNNSKEDYNLDKPGQVWDESSAKAHYNNRQEGQPFFAIFNFTVTHESQIRTRPHKAVHDPSKVRVPAYHPDTPEVRQDWAQYYDKITEMDALVGKTLKELDDAGLANDTIVFFYSDHGSGMPRNKRTPFNSGLHVPCLVHVPDKWKQLAPPDYKAGAETDRLISFVDLAPTLLSLVGVEPPKTMQGQAFMGQYITEPRQFVYGFRGRMDERIDLVRSVRDERYVYVRNFMPHKSYGQHVGYMFQTPTTQVWKKLFDEGKLNADQKLFWGLKPAEELYDLKNDPDEVHNLASSAEHQKVLQRLRQAQHDLALKIRDVGLLPEDEIHSRSKGSTPYDLAHDDKKYPLERILGTAELSSTGQKEAIPELKKRLSDDDSAVRYWAAMGLLIRGQTGVDASREELAKALDDPAPAVRITAGEALGRYGDEATLKKVLPNLLNLSNPEKHGAYVAVEALNAIDNVGSKAVSLKEEIAKLPLKDPKSTTRANEYVARLVSHLTCQPTKP
jgi:uncharacterized sulfatase